MPKVETLQGLVFVGLVVSFVVAEKLLPGRRPVSRAKHWKRDAVAFVVAGVGAAASQAALASLGHRLSIDEHVPAWVVALPSVARVLLGLAMIDFGLYWVHRAMHASNLLWPTHRWHHAIEHLYWFSGLRTSVTHAFLYAIPQVIFSVFVFRFTPLEGVAVAGIASFFQFYIHSSMDVGLGPLSWVFVTPRMHRLHHARSGTQQKNFGVFFTIFDRMFGTYVDPDAVPPPGALGIDEDVSTTRMLIGV